MNPINLIFFALYAPKAIIFDYLLQSAAMYNGKRARNFWLLPLLKHSATNGAGVALIALAFTMSPVAALGAFLFETVTHAAIDRFKGRIEVRCGGRTAGALDQLMHLSVYLIIWRLFLC